MTTQSNIPAGWFSDPHGAPQLLRYWDGSQWTEHTHPAGGQQTAAPSQEPVQQSQQGQPVQHGQPVPQGQVPQQQHLPQQAHAPQPVQQAHTPQPVQQPHTPQQAHVPPQQAAPGVPSLFTQQVLVVNQKAKLIEVTNEYSVFDQHGSTIGSVVQVGQSTLRKVLRFVSSIDQYLTHRLEIRDAHGTPQLLLTRPAKFIKSRIIVQRPDGATVGEIVQQNAIGKINFAIMADGRQVGAIKAENWRAWNFAIVDHNDAEIARITKTWEGLAKTMFTTADNYVLQIHYQLPEPLLSLVVATALTVDTALKQDARGFG
ncbi:phospholipid scramblase-related protein [Streptomyces sp. BE147]|uniref:phospholipid scramblase-related protein n=1 Tax=unclassified Streptomyces TaxID=2593676 RepID=UPI002E763896|nr:phospholipid scramblase-related protein [Streptomyces sp. BE147]MEE1742179.1 phospholipid scramblase-related protein [Streptomyces sp. BE147]